jgi:undecaprenyl phosphate N,N'-diacetylbacillosamine 1-phosphate transferase
LPLFLIISLLLVYVNNGKIFFKQKRIGYKCKEFYILKFRTMLFEGNDEEINEEDLASITPFGSYLRKFSLDELPQIFNILKGEMSFIGPRPLLVEYLKLYNAEQLKRHHVKPGITGWAQVNGRNDTTWQKRFTFDLEYVENISLLFDLKITLLTILKIFSKPDGQTTIDKFDGK